MPQSAASEVELVQGLPSNGGTYRCMRPSSDHNAFTLDFDFSTLPSTTSGKSGSSADNAISIASTSGAEPSSKEGASTPLASQVNSRSGSSSSLFSLAFDEEEDEDYAPCDAAGAGQGGKISKPAGSTSSKKTSVLGGQWSKREDAILVKAVDRLGTRWTEVCASPGALNACAYPLASSTASQVSREFNRLSRTTRSNRAVEARWRLILLGDKGKAPIMPRPTSSSSNAQQAATRHPSTSSTAKLSRQQSRKRSSWRKNEVAVLRESLDRHRNVTNATQALYRDFDSAFPKSTRTRSAIRNMTSKLLRGWDLPEEEEHEEDEGTGGEESSVLGDDEVESGSFAASELTAAASRAEEDSEVAITYMSNGLIIEDLPPHYHVKVYSPTRVKVGRKSSIDTADPPAFHVKSLNDGSTEAITLPEGTTKTVLKVLVEGSQGEGVVTECTYRGPDAYTLVVRAAL